MRSFLLSGIVSAFFLTLFPAQLPAVEMGDVTGFLPATRSVIVSCGERKVRIEAWDDDVIRVWLSADGKYQTSDERGGCMIQPGMQRFKGSTEFQVVDAGNHIKIKTKSLVVRVKKHPFGLAFYQSDDKTLITATPPGFSLDSDIRAVLQRDACGHKEHFVGLQLKNDAETLDHRDHVVNLKDENGAGWVAPFFMSSAGYGVFFNNEFSVDNRISFNKKIIIENTAKHGQLDLFFFRGTNYGRMIDLYTDLTGKPPMPPKKLLGFNYLVKGSAILEPVLDEEAFPEWVKREYPIDSCITFTDQRLATDTEIAAVDATARRVHDLHGALCCYFDLYTPGTFQDSRPWPTNYPYHDWTKFKETLKTRLLDHGVDWFWFDETEDLPYVHELYQATVEACEAQDNHRGFLCGRGGQAGCQRFGYPWMGDTDYGKASLLASLCNGLIGVAHSTHDMSGGVAEKTEDQYLSGVKANLLDPISQCNNWSPGWIPSHLPWEWSSRAEHVFRKYLDLHYQLIPYFYTMFWQAHTTGLPDWRPLVLDQPERADLYARDETMIGDWLLMAPLYQKNVRDVYLPPGKWHGYFDGVTYAGDQIIKNYHSTPDGYPLFVKAGAIIPMMPTMRYVDEKPMDPLTFDIYPEGSSLANLYEDDGVTREYIKGNYCVTEITCVSDRNAICVSLKNRKGLYNPGPRGILFKVLCPVCPSEVLVDGQKLDRLDSLAALTGQKSGWGFFPDANSGAYKTFVAFPTKGESVTVKLVIDAQAEQPPKPAGDATFMALTGGNCDSRKIQGTNGMWRPLDEKGIPSYATLAVAGGIVKSWANSSGDVSDLTVSATGERPLACLLGTNLQLDLNVTGRVSHAVCLHLMDWNQKGRSARVECFDAATGRAIDVETIPRYDQGIAIAYMIRGHVIIKVTSLSGPDVALSGISFGWQPEIEYAGRRTENAVVQNTLGKAGHWIIGGNKSLPVDTSVAIRGQTKLLEGIDSTTGKPGSPFLGITDPDREIEVCVNGSEPVRLTIHLRDCRTVKPKDYWEEAKQTITFSAFDLPGGGKLRTLAVRPDGLGTGGYISYIIRGHVKLTISDAGDAASALCGIFLDPVHD